MPAHAGILAVSRIWIPAYAGMTFHLYIHCGLEAEARAVLAAGV
jgi:hypothetical protein